MALGVTGLSRLKLEKKDWQLSSTKIFPYPLISSYSSSELRVSSFMKLHSYGIRSATLRGIQAFLGNRLQKVVVEDEESDFVPVKSGVPQGSVLGPILFLVYINDLPDDIVSQVRLFSDDTAIYLTLENKCNSDKLQRDLDRLQTWEARWDMEFNP